MENNLGLHGAAQSLTHDHASPRLSLAVPSRGNEARGRRGGVLTAVCGVVHTARSIGQTSRTRGARGRTSSRRLLGFLGAAPRCHLHVHGGSVDGAQNTTDKSGCAGTHAGAARETAEHLALALGHAQDHSRATICCCPRRALVRVAREALRAAHANGSAGQGQWRRVQQERKAAGSLGTQRSA